jgi:hypothetical protein
MSFNITCKDTLKTSIVPIGMVTERYFHALQNEGCKEVSIENENEIFFKGIPKGSGIRWFRNSGLLEISSGHIVIRGFKETLRTSYTLKCRLNSWHLVGIFQILILGVVLYPLALIQRNIPLPNDLPSTIGFIILVMTFMYFFLTYLLTKRRMAEVLLDSLKE